MNLIEDKEGNFLNRIFMPSNFGERGNALPGVTHLAS